MNADPSVNVVVFEVALHGRLEKLVGDGATRSNNCIQMVWNKLAAEHGARPDAVRRVYSEWEPSAEDKQFMDATFPAEVAVTYSFPRPAAPDGWEQAMREVAATIEKATQWRSAPPRKSWWQFWK